MRSARGLATFYAVGGEWSAGGQPSAYGQQSFDTRSERSARPWPSVEDQQSQSGLRPYWKLQYRHGGTLFSRNPRALASASRTIKVVRSDSTLPDSNT